jgi:ABC-type cobalamin/Fe3+-siderophores transport system ATPase subunit
MIIDDGNLLFFGTPDDAIVSNMIKKAFDVECLKIEVNGQTEYICRP